MSKTETEILQIRKYLNGELDARAMHHLEKEALNDPFLMEALEGYEKTAINQENNLAGIHLRLRSRTKEKERRIISWRMISIAASILIILGIGGLWLKYEQPAGKSPLIAQADKGKIVKPVIKPAPSINIIQKPASPVGKQTEYAAIHKNKKIDTEIIAAASESDAAPQPATGYMADNNRIAIEKRKMINIDSGDKVVAKGFGTKKRSDTAGNLASVAIKDQQLLKSLPGKVDGVNMSPAKFNSVTGIVIARSNGLPMPGVNVNVTGTNINTQTNSNGRFLITAVAKGAVLEFAAPGYDRKVVVANKDSLAVNLQASNQQLGEVVVTGALGIKTTEKSLGYSTAKVTENNDTGTKNMAVIIGVVTAKNDGLPIPGVVVKIKGTYITTITDSNGKFTLRVPIGSTLDFSYIGYETASIAVHKRDSMFVALKSNEQSLAEVVVTGYGTAIQSSQLARPHNGWQEYRSYLNTNAISPDGKTGTVKLSFTVNSDNTLSDFKIIKSVSAKTDSTAISLVKYGPGWLRNMDNKPQKVKVKVKFTNK